MNKCLVILGCFLTFVLCGCSGEVEDDLIDVLANEKQAIHDYLNQHATGEVLAIPYYSRKGMLIDSIFIFNHSSNGDVAKDSGWVVMDYDMYDLNDKVWDTTDPEKWSEEFTPGYAYGGPVLHRVDTARYNFLGEAFRHIGVGDAGGEVIIPSVLGAVDGRTLRYKLTSYNVFDDIAEHEKELMDADMVPFSSADTLHVLPGEVKSDTITYIIFLEREGDTRKLQTGDSVLLNMVYGILDEKGLSTRTFRAIREDTTKILFNERWQRDIPSGLTKGLQRLQQGDSAHILIPYGMAYGAAGRTQSAQGGGKYYLEPPYCTLWCWVRIKEIFPQNQEE